MQGVVTLTSPIMPDLMNQDLNIILELFYVLFAFGLLVELLAGLSVPSEGHNLQPLRKMALVRAENFQFH